MSTEQVEGIIGDPSSWRIHEKSGPLVEVLIPGGRGAKIKMHLSEAIRLGYLKEERGAESVERKAKAQAPNKARRPGANKGDE